MGISSLPILNHPQRKSRLHAVYAFLYGLQLEEALSQVILLPTDWSILVGTVKKYVVQFFVQHVQEKVKMSSAGYTGYFYQFHPSTVLTNVIDDLTKLTASVNGLFGGPLLKNGFLPISSSSIDKIDVSV